MDLSSVCVERSTPDDFWVPSHRFNSATGEQKKITQIICTDSELQSRMPNSLVPSAKLRRPKLPFLRLWCDAIGDRIPASRTPSRHSNHYATRGAVETMGGPMQDHIWRLRAKPWQDYIWRLWAELWQGQICRLWPEQ